MLTFFNKTFSTLEIVSTMKTIPNSFGTQWYEAGAHNCSIMCSSSALLLPNVPGEQQCPLCNLELLMGPGKQSPNRGLTLNQVA